MAICAPLITLLILTHATVIGRQALSPPKRERVCAHPGQSDARVLAVFMLDVRTVRISCGVRLRFASNAPQGKKGPVALLPEERMRQAWVGYSCSAASALGAEALVRAMAIWAILLTCGRTMSLTSLSTTVWL